AAQAFGDAVIAALDRAEPAARIGALDAIDPPGPEGEILLALLSAGEAGPDGQDAAADRLRRAAETPDLAERYGHLALLKAHMLAPSSPEEARIVLGALAEPGAPYAALAEEQLALLDIAEGDREAGLERLRRLESAAEATPGLQQRVAQLIVALESGAGLVDTSPAEEAAFGAADTVEAGAGEQDAAAADAEESEAEEAGAEEADAEEAGNEEAGDGRTGDAGDDE
ncbi:MAG: hypothetical protein ACOCY0_04720, partial [Roseicyclus sp.]